MVVLTFQIPNDFCCALTSFLEKLFSTICWYEMTFSFPVPNNWIKSRLCDTKQNKPQFKPRQSYLGDRSKQGYQDWVLGLRHLIWRVMPIGNNTIILCSVRDEAENAGLLKLENGANTPWDQRSIVWYQFLTFQMSVEFLVEPNYSPWSHILWH